MKKIILFAVIALLISGCRSKKVVTEDRETVRIDTVKVFQKVTDTIFKDRIVEKTKPVYFETEIPCDENQKGKVGSGNNFTEYEIKDGKVYLKTNIDSISNHWESFYRTKTIQDSVAVHKQLEEKYSKTSEVKVYVYPWWIYALIFGVILFAGLWVYTKFFTPL